MKKYLFIAVFSLLCACKASVVPPSEVISALKTSGSNYQADGTSVIDVWVTINKDADADKRSVIFSSNIGTFLPSNDTTSTVTAGFENGQLIARTKFKMPLAGGALYIKARPATINRLANYQISDTLQIGPSVPATLKLLPSSLGVKTGFTNEVTLTATLKNSSGNSVSAGTSVLFENIPAVGAFRMIRDTTDATSTAARTFTAGNTVAPATVMIRCTYIDKTGARTAIKDSCIINITN